METVRVRNSSGRDLDVLMPHGGFRTVRAGEHLETSEEHSVSLAEQVDVWKRVTSPGAERPEEEPKVKGKTKPGPPAEDASDEASSEEGGAA